MLTQDKNQKFNKAHNKANNEKYITYNYYVIKYIDQLR